MAMSESSEEDMALLTFNLVVSLDPHLSDQIDNWIAILQGDISAEDKTALAALLVRAADATAREEALDALTPAP